MKAKNNISAKLFLKYVFTALFPILFVPISLLFSDGISAWFYMVFAGWIVLFAVFGVKSTRMVFHAEELLGESLSGTSKTFRKIEVFCETHPDRSAQLKKEFYAVKNLKISMISYFAMCVVCVIATIVIMLLF